MKGIETASNVLAIEGSIDVKPYLLEFSESLENARIAEVRHVGADPSHFKLFLLLTATIIPSLAKLYLNLKEIDRKVKIKFNGVEIIGIKNADDIESIVTAIKKATSNDK